MIAGPAPVTDDEQARLDQRALGVMALRADPVVDHALRKMAVELGEHGPTVRAPAGPS